MKIRISDAIGMLFEKILSVKEKREEATQSQQATSNEATTDLRAHIVVKWTPSTARRKHNAALKEERTTPERIEELEQQEVFVFGTDHEGEHSMGASRCAVLNFGAIKGKPEGIQGRSYAIPTDFLETEDIKPAVDRFVSYALRNPKLTFLVTPIGCGAAGHSPHEMARLFIKASDVPNICLPAVFWDELNR